MLTNNLHQHLLVVDDDERIRVLLQKYLVSEGYFVSSVKNTAEAEEILLTIKCDLIILDLMMPGETGIEFIERLNRNKLKNIPIIMLTAMGEVGDRVAGLEVGADDYLVKPFEPKELSLRISNLLKHNSLDGRELFHFGDYSYNIKSQSLLKRLQNIFLTSSEHSLLGFLLQNKGQIVTREKLATELYINERSVDVKIVRLRSKIEESSSRPVFLQTIRGQGYIFNCY
jgi:two-component system, OmpR family, phosphate regulon response regulator OmpR